LLTAEMKHLVIVINNTCETCEWRKNKWVYAWYYNKIWQRRSLYKEDERT